LKTTTQIQPQGIAFESDSFLYYALIYILEDLGIKGSKIEMRHLKIIVIVGIVLLATVLPIRKADLPIEPENEQNDMVSYDYLNDHELVITFHLSELQEKMITTEEGDFIQFTIPHSGFFGDIGSPQLPAVTRVVAVSTAVCSLEIINTHIQQTRKVTRVYPVQSPQSDEENQGTPDFIYDAAAYERDDVLPEQLVEITGQGKIRDIPFLKIRFCPLQYNPFQQIVTIYDTVEVKLIYATTPSLVVEQEYTQKPFYPFYENVFDNWPGFVSHTIFHQQDQQRDTGCDYLIITHPNYYDQAVELAEWKHSTGLSSKTVNVTDIGSTSQVIRQYLIDAYETWVPRPSYLLLLGDAEFIPTSYSSGAATDLLYATLNGSDYYPDLFIGRIPADTADEAAVMIQKTLTYEQTPPTLPGFYQNFVVAAYFQDDDYDSYEDRRFVLTSEEVRDYLLSQGYDGQRIYCTDSNVNPTHYNNGYYANGEPLPPELLRPTFAWDGDANDIIAALQEGIFILNHRDHGMESGWGDPYFTTGHFNSFANGELLPVVFSLNCLTGAFDSGECFCEEFLRKDDGGAVAAFGATEVSYSGYNDYLCRGLYDGLWPEFDPELGADLPMYTLGEILNYGKAYMADTWGDAWGYEEYTFKLFHCFGDPSLDLYTALPGALEVDVTVPSQMIHVSVQSGGVPLQQARVCLRQESGFYQTGLTDASGVIEFDMTGTSMDDEVSFVVTAHNYLPSMGNFSLNQRPQKPERPTGSTEGKPKIKYTYTTSAIDVDGDTLYYRFSWGDGTYSGWIGPFPSGEEASAKHSWNEKGIYNITVKARDTLGQESGWSDPLSVAMPVEYANPHPILHWLSQVILQRFPFFGAFLEKIASTI